MRLAVVGLVALAGCSASHPVSRPSPSPSPTVLSVDLSGFGQQSRFDLACDEVNIAAHGSASAAGDAAAGFGKLTDPAGRALAGRVVAGDFGFVLQVCSANGYSP